MLNRQTASQEIISVAPSSLNISPDQILTEEKDNTEIQQEKLFARLNACSQKDRATALKLLSVFLDSLN